MKPDKIVNQVGQHGSPPAAVLEQGGALTAAIALPLLIGAAGAVATSRSLSTWYSGLRKPPFNPPSWVFAPVWTVLYVVMGIASWLVWQQSRAQSRLGGWFRPRNAQAVRGALTLYGLQLAANLAWSWLFFGLRRIDLALAEIIILWGLILATLVRFRQIRPLAGWLLAPYHLWVSFAALLNFSIWWLNRDQRAAPNQQD